MSQTKVTPKNYTSVEEFVKEKFGSENPKQFGNLVKMFTSMSTKDTINGKNAIVVMAKTKGISSMIMEAGKLEGDGSVRVNSESTSKYAILFVRYAHKVRGYGPTSMPALPFNYF